MSKSVDLVAFFFTSADNVPPMFDGTNVSIINGIAQTYSGVASVILDAASMTGFLNIAGISGVAGMITAIKITADIEHGNDVMLGDVIGVVANGVMVTAGIVAVGTATIPASILIGTLGVVAAAAGYYANQNKWTINDLTSTAYTASRTRVDKRDPLALDLDGDGLETTGISGIAPILFDHDGDGIRTGTGWLQGDDAFLALDRNGNGVIDNGSELFGVDTVLTTGPNAGQTASNGFAALADLDSNGDGVFNSLDAQYANVRLWRDLNQDGVSQSDELGSLADAGIAGINLASTATNIALAGGNVQSAAGTYTKSNGQTGAVGDFTTGTSGNLDLTQNPFYSDFTDHITLTTAAQALPNMQASGSVRDLQEAASLDATLVSDVAGLAGTTRSQMLSALDPLITHWAATSTMNTSIGAAASKGYTLVYLPPGMSIADYIAAQNAGAPSSGSSGGGGGSGTGIIGSGVDLARLQALQAQEAHLEAMLGVLERFNGLPFVTVGENSVTTGQGWAISASTQPINTGGSGSGLPTTQYAFVNISAGQLSLLEQSYEKLKESVYGGVVTQTRLKPYMDDISLTIDATGIKLDFSAMEAAMDTLHTTDPANALIDRIDLFKYAGISLGASGWDGTEKINTWVEEAIQGGYFATVKSTSGAAFSSQFTQGDDFYLGTGSAETISVMSGNDMVFAGGENDVVYGDAGNDYLNGGAGTDTLYGGGGQDTLDGGAGNDFLQGGAGNNTYIFRAGNGYDTINAEDTTVGRVETLVLEGLNPADIRLEKWNIYDLGVVIVSTGEWVNLLNFFAEDDYKLDAIQFADGTVWNRATLMAQPTYLYGGSGSDTLVGRNGGPNAIYGNNGNDSLYGGDGNDILDGGAGDDYLKGNAGNDTYVFGRGSGHDTLNAYDTSAGRIDTLVLEGLNPSDIRLEKWNGADVGLVIVDTGEWINLQSYLNGSNYQLNAIKFADGTIWDQATILGQEINLYGTSGNDPLMGRNDGPNAIYGNEGEDTLSGRDFNDRLFGGSGNDTLYGNAGNDTLDGGSGDDYLSGGVGNDTYVLRRGSGHDTLNAYDATAGRIETLVLEGLNSSDIRLEKWNTNDLGVVIKDTALFNGGADNDTLTGGASAEIYLGGTGNDTYTTGGGNDIILFSTGDGQDTFATGGTGSDTLSLGGSFAYSDLSFSKSSNDLILKVSATDQVTFKDWYAVTPSKPVVNMQVITEAMAGFSAGGSDPLLDQKVENFNFAGLVGAFDAARAANTGLTTWALTSALTNFQLAGSNTAAMGGDLAYQYGKNGTLAGIALTSAQTAINDSNFGTQAQNLNSLTKLQTGSVRLS